MDNAAKLRLKQYLEDNIPFYELKVVGFWPNGTRKNDYEKIAARICQFFGLKSIYDYSHIEDRIKQLNSIQQQEYKLPFDQTDLISQCQYLN
jgi:hypothetical protein